MTGTVYHIRPEQVPSLVPSYDPPLIEYANASAELYAGFWDGQCICLLGLIPRSFLADAAYLWFHAVDRSHPLAFIRHAKVFVTDALRRYASLTGHCNTTPAKRWLAFLGAQFTPISGDLVQFEIKSWTHQA